MMQWRDFGKLPYLAQDYPAADDRNMYSGLDYYDNNIINISHEGDVRASPVRSKKNCDTVHDKKEMEGDNVFWRPTTISTIAYANQVQQDRGIIYERHNKGIPILQILDVKLLQHGSEDHVNYSWKLDEATKECKLEIIGQSDKNDTDKECKLEKTVKFSFATNDTDKLLSQVVDGYEVKYMLRTDVMRLRIRVEVLPASDNIIDIKSVWGKVMLAIKYDGEPQTIIDLLDHKPQSKKLKLDCSNDTLKYSFVGIIPRNHSPMMKLTVTLKDSTGRLDVDKSQYIFPYNIPVDQRDYIDFNNGYVLLNVFWGCTLQKAKGVCTGVCTCELGEFVGFASSGDVSINIAMRSNED